ncbi:MAG TPA: heparin lyase I family protein [Polyangia bacterium]|jgi:MYXO-CTERM domain-containing protein|nr:heparin lyase I family protein [Polyangia bacterium]
MKLHSRWLPLVVAGLLVESAPARAAVIWKADFETGSISQFMGNVNATQGARKNIEIIADPVQEGKMAGKFTIHADDTFAGTQMRVQVTRNSPRTGEGQDVFMSFYFLVAADPMVRANIAYWETTGSNRNMMTWWLVAKPGGGTTLNYGTGNLGNGKHLFTGDVSLNAWHQVGYHVHWSQSAATGRVTMWFDGTQVVDEAAQTKPDGNSLFFQAGIHRGSRSTLIDTVFFDNFLEGDAVTDIMLAAAVPGVDGGASPDAPSATDGASDVAAGTGGAGGGGSGGTTGTGGQSGQSGQGGQGGQGGVTGSGGTSGGGSGTNPGTGTGGATGLTGSSGCAVSAATAPAYGSLPALVALLGATILVRRRRR